MTHRRMLPRGARLAAAVTLTLASMASSAAPNEIVLKDGSRIVGDITGSRDGVVTVETDFAGTLEIPLEKVQSLRSPEPLVMLFEDDSVVEEELVIEDGQLVQADGQPSPHLLETLAVVNPEPWELGQGYNWTGLANVAFKMERGNSDTDELDYKIETQLISDDDRYTFKLNGEIDEANNEKNADNWQGVVKWDYFLTDPNYWGLQLFAEKDKFADLNLRTLVGPYYGRQIFNDPIFKFSAEVGASYVDEDFDVAEDQDYPAGNWNFDISSNYLGGDSRLYFNQFGVWNLDETSDVIVNSTFGLAFPLLWNFEAAAEVLFEYDSGAVDDVDDLDETYSFRVGYTW